MRNIRLILCLLILALTLGACGGEKAPSAEVQTAPQTTTPAIQTEQTTEAAEPEETEGEVPATEPKISMAAIYEKMTGSDTMPEMMEMDETMQRDYCGISREDVAQSVVAICADGLRTDEIWLIQAVDEAAAERIAELARTRQKAKEDETVNYAPDQYAIVEKAELVQEGEYVAFLVSPEAKALTEIFRQEIG